MDEKWNVMNEFSPMNDYVNNDDVGNDVDNDPHTLSHELFLIELF